MFDGRRSISKRRKRSKSKRRRSKSKSSTGRGLYKGYKVYKDSIGLYTKTSRKHRGGTTFKKKYHKFFGKGIIRNGKVLKDEKGKIQDYLFIHSKRRSKKGKF